MIKQYNVTVNGTTYEVTVESAAGGNRMASAPVSLSLIHISEPALPRLLLPALPLPLPLLLLPPLPLLLPRLPLPQAPALSPAPCPAPSLM